MVTVDTEGPLYRHPILSLTGHQVNLDPFPLGVPLSRLDPKPPCAHVSLV